MRFKDLRCAPSIEAGVGLRMTEEVFFYFALGILKPEELNGSAVTEIDFLQHSFS